MSASTYLQQYRVSNKTFPEQYENIFIWKINNFSLSLFKVNQPIYSALFRTESFHGSPWYIEIYPLGTSTSGIGFSSVFLVSKREDYRIINCRYSIEIIRADGSVLYSKSSDCQFCHYERRGWHDYIETDKLQRSVMYIPDNVLTIRCLLHDTSSYKPLKTTTVAETNIGFDRICFNWFIKTDNCYNTIQKSVECPGTSKYLIKLRKISRAIFLSITRLPSSYHQTLKNRAMLKLSLFDSNFRICYTQTHEFNFDYDCNFHEVPTFLSAERLPILEMRYSDYGGFTLLCDFFVTNQTHVLETDACISCDA